MEGIRTAGTSAVGRNGHVAPTPAIGRICLVRDGGRSEGVRPKQPYASRDSSAFGAPVTSTKRRLFQHRVMDGSSSAQAERIGRNLEEETPVWIISLASTSRWTRHTPAFSVGKVRSFMRARRSRRRKRSLTSWRKRRSSHRLPDGTDGADPLSLIARARISRGLHREPAGLSGAQVACDPQDRSPREGWRISAVPAPLSPCTGSRCRSCTPLADHRPPKTRRSAGDFGNQIRGLVVVFGIRLPRALTAGRLASDRRHI
jgi:hypothetical protein